MKRQPSGGHRVYSGVRLAIMAAVAASAAGVGGCNGFQTTTPSPAANLSALAPAEINREYATRPAAQFPVTIAVARVQGATGRAHDGSVGRYTIITAREAEQAIDVEPLRGLPQVRGVVGFNSLMSPSRSVTGEALRGFAARLHADMLLLYTLETRYDSDHYAEPVGLLTLGLAPNQRARVRCTASAILLDVRTGYLYGAGEHTASANRVTNAWSQSQSYSELRRGVEAEALEALVTHLHKSWNDIVATHAQSG